MFSKNLVKGDTVFVFAVAPGIGTGEKLVSVGVTVDIAHPPGLKGRKRRSDHHEAD